MKLALLGHRLSSVAPSLKSPPARLGAGATLRNCIFSGAKRELHAAQGTKGQGQRPIAPAGP